MSQALTRPKTSLKAQLMRLIGPALLVVLLLRLDLGQARDTLRSANVMLIVLAAIGVLPLIFVKTVRWRSILSAHRISLPLLDSYLVYFSSLFIGFLTPGRLGEFIKAVYVTRSCHVSMSRAFAGVLADRLFDFYALLVIGSLALLDLFPTAQSVTLVIGIIVALASPLVLYLYEPTFRFFQRIGLRFGALGRKFFDEETGILPGLRTELLHLPPRIVALATLSTALAYLLFYGQGYLLARALDIDAGFVQIMFAVALGSLVTLIPISISGLGTRELAIITYLESVSVPPEAALGFSLLIFFNFQVVGGVIGAIAWWIKPIPAQSEDPAAEGAL